MQMERKRDEVEREKNMKITKKKKENGKEVKKKRKQKNEGDWRGREGGTQGSSRFNPLMKWRVEGLEHGVQKFKRGKKGSRVQRFRSAQQSVASPSLPKTGYDCIILRTEASLNLHEVCTCGWRTVR